jgi:hypothetical protein
MNATQIESQFAGIGARFKLRLSLDRWETNDYAIDIRRDRQGEFFELRLAERLRDSVDASVLQADKRDRHLLLLVRRPEEKLDRFLCGHDERHWFVRSRLSQLGVRSTQWNLRKNAGLASGGAEHRD